MKFYVDTCIYLNLWMKESSREGFPWWKYAEEFFEKAKLSGAIIYYSSIVLKELVYKLSEEKFQEKTKIFRYPFFKRITLTKKELKLARKIESEIYFEISFFDILHLLLAKKTNSILITRDNKLIMFARKYSVEAKKPEEL